MDAAVDGIPPIMWEPDRSMSTKMDELRIRINEKYNVDLRKCNLFRISSAFYRLFTALVLHTMYVYPRSLWTQKLLLLTAHVPCIYVSWYIQWHFQFSYNLIMLLKFPLNCLLTAKFTVLCPKYVCCIYAADFLHYLSFINIS